MEDWFYKCLKRDIFKCIEADFSDKESDIYIDPKDRDEIVDNVTEDYIYHFRMGDYSDDPPYWESLKDLIMDEIRRMDKEKDKFVLTENKEVYYGL